MSYFIKLVKEVKYKNRSIGNEKSYVFEYNSDN